MIKYLTQVKAKKLAKYKIAENGGDIGSIG
jgi:hypothetical protein